MIKISTVLVGALAVNCYVVTDSETGKTAVIDPGAYEPELDAVLSKIGFENIEYILLTHGHFDHIGGVNDLIKKTGGKAKVAVFAAETALMNNPRSNLSMPFMGVPGDEVHADIKLNDGDTITLGESVFTVIHTPGHTPGSVCYVCGRDIFSGDTLFCLSAGRTDFPGGSAKQLMQSLQKLAALDGDYSVHPGHNNETTLSDERRMNPYINRLY